MRSSMVLARCRKVVRCASALARLMVDCGCRFPTLSKDSKRVPVPASASQYSRSARPLSMAGARSYSLLRTRREALRRPSSCPTRRERRYERGDHDSVALGTCCCVATVCRGLRRVARTNSAAFSLHASLRPGLGGGRCHCLLAGHVGRTHATVEPDRMGCSDSLVRQLRDHAYRRHRRSSHTDSAAALAAVSYRGRHRRRGGVTVHNHGLEPCHAMGRAFRGRWPELLVRDQALALAHDPGYRPRHIYLCPSP